MANEHCMEEVFSGSFWEASIVKSLLEDAAITVYLYDEINKTTIPWIPSIRASNVMKIFVTSADSEKAQKILTNYTSVCS